MALFTHTSGQYLSRGDASLYFEVTGSDAGFPLVFLHGGMGNMTDFNVILGPFCQDFKLIAMDFRGHGKSSLGTKALSYQTYQEDVEALVAYLGIKEYALMGFSDGGITAYRLASKKCSKSAEKVKALVAIAAHQSLQQDDYIYPLLASMNATKWRHKFSASVAYYNRVNPDPDFDQLMQSVVALWTGQKASAYPIKSVKYIKVPTLLVRGHDDPLFSENDLIELGDLIKGSKSSTIKGSGHESYQDNPYAFMLEVKPFLLESLALEKSPAC